MTTDLVASTNKPSAWVPQPSARMRTALAAAAGFGLPALLIGFIMVFSVLAPTTFATLTNAKTVLSTQSVLAVLALAALLTLVIGEFDLSLGAQMGLSAILVPGLSANHALSIPAAIAAAIATTSAVGFINGILVTKLKVSSFIATIGTAALIGAFVLAYSGGSVIFDGVPPQLLQISLFAPLGIPVPILYLTVVGLIAWTLLERTPFGRYMFAVGGSKDAARLSGINTDLITLLTFTAAGTLTGVAGVIEAGQLGSGNPSVGPSFLLTSLRGGLLGGDQLSGGPVQRVRNAHGRRHDCDGRRGAQYPRIARLGGTRLQWRCAPCSRDAHAVPARPPDLINRLAPARTTLEKLMDRLKGKIALVSGGARGMGAAHARAIIAEGGKVVIADILDGDGEVLARQLGPSACYVRLDVTKGRRLAGCNRPGDDGVWQSKCSGQQRRHLQFRQPREVRNERLARRVGRQSDRRVPRHEIGASGAYGGGAGLDHQHLLDRRTPRLCTPARLHGGQMGGARIDEIRRHGSRPPQHPRQLRASGRDPHTDDQRHGRLVARGRCPRPRRPTRRGRQPCGVFGERRIELLYRS